MRRFTTPDPAAAIRAAALRLRLAPFTGCRAQRRLRWRPPLSFWDGPWAGLGNGPLARKRSIRPWSALALLYLLAAVAWVCSSWAPRASPTEERVTPPECLSSGTPSRRALMDSAFWWAQSVQVANDEYDEERAALAAWDPEAVSDKKAELRRLLASDPSGYLLRARRRAVR